MFLTQEGMRLHMKLDMPADSPARCPLVIVIHGFTGHMEERHILAAMPREAAPPCWPER